MNRKTRRFYERNAGQSPWKDGEWPLPVKPTDRAHAVAIYDDSERQRKKQGARLMAVIQMMVNAYDGACLAWLAEEWAQMEAYKKDYAEASMRLFDLIDETSQIMEAGRIAKRFLADHPPVDGEPLTEDERRAQEAREHAEALARAERAREKAEREKLRQGSLFDGGCWGGTGSGEPRN